MAAKKTTRKTSKRKPATTKPMRAAPTCSNTGSFAYLLGILGAAIYYVSTATGFWAGALGIIKSLIWPLFLVHGLLASIGA